MYDPPHVDGSLLETLLVTGEVVDVFYNQQSLMGCCRLSHCFCREEKKVEDELWGILDGSLLVLKRCFGFTYEVPPW